MVEMWPRLLSVTITFIEENQNQLLHNQKRKLDQFSCRQEGRVALTFLHII